MCFKISLTEWMAILTLLILTSYSSFANTGGGGGGGGGGSNVLSVDDLKAFKKHLRTHVNVLTVFCGGAKDDALLTTLEDAAKEMKGKASVVRVNCGSKEGKKTCKKFKVRRGVAEAKKGKEST